MVNKTKFLSSIVGFLIGLSPLSIWFLIGQDTIVSAEMAETIFLTLIQVNATLIGFFGIVLVYHLREYSNTTDSIINKTIETIEKRDLIGCEIQDNKGNEEVVNSLQRKWNVYNDNVTSLAKWISKTAKEKSNFEKISIIPVTGFVLSILGAVIGLTKINVEGIESALLTFVLIPLFLGVVVLVLSMGSSAPSRQENSNSQSSN